MITWKLVYRHGLSVDRTIAIKGASDLLWMRSAKWPIGHDAYAIRFAKAFQFGEIIINKGKILYKPT